LVVQGALARLRMVLLGQQVVHLYLAEVAEVLVPEKPRCLLTTPGVKAVSLGQRPLMALVLHLWELSTDMQVATPPSASAVLAEGEELLPPQLQELAATVASPVVALEVEAHPSTQAPQAQAAQGAVALSS
jgi:hypothetical protein